MSWILLLQVVALLLNLWVLFKLRATSKAYDDMERRLEALVRERTTYVPLRS